MATAPSMRAFIEDLRQVEDKTQRAILRFQYEVGVAIVRRTQERIKATFGQGRQMAGYAARQALTERAYGGSARRSGRGGGLMNSVVLAREGESIGVSVGGPGVPYAAAHEEGATITPRNSRFLTIPFGPRFAGTRAREHALRFAMGVMVDGEPVGAALILRGAVQAKDGSVSADNVAFVLRRRVTIPARPYFAPAIDEATRGPELRTKIMELLGRDRLTVTVE